MAAFKRITNEQVKEMASLYLEGHSIREIAEMYEDISTASVHLSIKGIVPMRSDSEIKSLLSESDVDDLVSRYENGEKIQNLQESFNVSRATVYRYLKTRGATPPVPKYRIPKVKCNKPPKAKGKRGRRPTVSLRVSGVYPDQGERAIYYLVDKCNIPFYVGSTKNPSIRLSSHIQAFGGRDIYMRILRCVPADQSPYWESKLLVDMIELGYDMPYNTEAPKRG